MEAASYHTKAIKVAKSELGTKKTGGISSSGFDCSGLVKYSYQKAGKNLPRTAADIYKIGKKVKSVQKGDLMFFAPNEAKKPTHVAIYIGNNEFIHSSSSKGVSYAKTIIVIGSQSILVRSVYNRRKSTLM
ncbi:C40 family peptidase [Peribacillus sp. V2I11]|uniref:C40 family peptidase n=1 Tax=Peribacillus sp. V2I11 TaxID=3042277 RepID=UPI0027D90708|nr:C40 family peptidase [Peribacillus sp. V2I11]